MVAACPAPLTPHHAGRSVMMADVLPQVVLGEVADVVLGAQDGAPQGAVLEGRRVQVVEDDLLRHALDLQQGQWCRPQQ